MITIILIKLEGQILPKWGFGGVKKELWGLSKKKIVGMGTGPSIVSYSLREALIMIIKGRERKVIVENKCSFDF